MAVWRILSKSLLILVAGIAIGTALLTFAYMLPVNPENQRSSYELLDAGGWYPRASVSEKAWAEHFSSFYPDVLDGSSDKVMLQTALDDSEGNPLKRAMNSYSEYMGAYNYYWHGYVSVLRPLFLLFDYSEVRILNGACQLLLLAALAYLIGRSKGFKYVLMLVTSYLLLSPVAVSMGLHFSGVFLIAYGSTLVMLLKRDFWGQRFRYVYFFLAAGMLTSYFDLLTYPLLAWGMPAVWMLVTDETVRREFEWIRCVVLSGVAWIVGYAVMWVAKWGIASLVLGTNVFESAINEVLLRSGASEGAAREGDRWRAVYANWKHYGYKVFALILVIWLIGWFVVSVRRGWARSGKRYSYFLIGFSSIVWYFVLSNQTLIHHFFTYRIFGVSILAFLALVLESVPCGSGRLWDRANILGQCLIWGGAAVLSLPMMLLAREEIVVFNGTEAFRTVRVERELTVELTPTYGRVTKFGLGMKPAEDRGGYLLEILDDDGAACREEYLLGDDNNYRVQEVQWELRGGKTYRLSVKVEENDPPLYVWVTEEGSGLLAEYGSLFLDGQETEGQLLTGIYYYDNAGVSREGKIFLMLSWTGILAAAGYVFIPRRGLGNRWRKA